MKIKKYSIPIICYTCWCGLGFVRGANSYKYRHNKYEINHGPYIYSEMTINGFFGIIIYGHPIFLLLTMYKEIYRLESNIRNLEDQKKSDFYNNLLL